jgi:predicted ATP-grasp superfamily ATP-dependent carboligase
VADPRRASGSWRNTSPVLVTDAQAMGPIAVIRSLGRAGYPVHACAESERALGLHSRFAARSIVCPAYKTEAFLPWLREYIAREKISAIVPSEGFLLAVRGDIEEFLPILPLSRDPRVIFEGLSKCDLFEAFGGGTLPNQALAHLPRSFLVRNEEEIPVESEWNRIGSPFFIKVDACHSRTGQQGSKVHRVSAVSEAQECVRNSLRGYHKVLVQGFVSGWGVGAFVLLWEGKLLAQFMHRRLHEVPHTGGASSFRESWWNTEIRDDALSKLNAIRWQGVAMMEYRLNPSTGEFFLLEMNGRFWGSLHLALYAGVDFPRMLLDAFHGREPQPMHQFTRRVLCRDTFPREIQYVWSRWKDRELPLASRLGSIVEFFVLGLDPRVYADLWFPRDRRLYLLNLKRSIPDLFSRG